MRCTRRIAAATLFLAGCVPLSAQRLTTEHASSKSAAANAPAGSQSESAVKAIGGPAALFVENQGQFDPAAKYKLTTLTGAIWLTATGVVFDGIREAPAHGVRSRALAAPSPANFEVLRGLAGPGRIGFEAKSPERVVLSETFVGSSPNVALEAGEPSNPYDYFTDTEAARWPSSVRAFYRVDYKDVWPDISVRLIAGSIGIERQFIIQPGANAGNIAISYHGIDDMTIAEQGSLAIGTVLGKRREGFSQSSSASAGVPVINFFDVAPTSTLPGQAAIGTLSVSGATSATLNGVEAHCSNGQCAGTVLFYPTSTTDYVLQASGAGGNVSASQQVEVGQYEPNPPPLPVGLQVTWQGACWLRHYPKSYCNGACQGMAFSVNVPTPPSELPLEATLYMGTTKCSPAQQDNMNDLGTLTGSGGWVFWFNHHPNLRYTSAIWTIGNQSSGCVSYAKAPDCP